MDEHTEPESPADGEPGRTGPTAAGDTAMGATNVAGNGPAEQPAQQFAGPGTGPGWQQDTGPGTGPGWQPYAAPGAYPPPAAGSSWYRGHIPGAPADGTVPPGHSAPGAVGYSAPSAAGSSATGAQPTVGPSARRPTWGAPPAASPGTASQTRTRWKPWQKVAAGAGLAAVVAVGGVAAVTAANASSDNQAGRALAGAGYGPGGGFGPGAMAGESGTADGAMPGGPGFARRGGAMGLMNALHGEFVVELNGSTQTRRLQTGKVTAVGNGSLTVSSTDNFSATYVVGSDLDVSSIAVGDTVRVIASVDGSTVTAISVQSDDDAGTGTAGQAPVGQGGGTQGMPGGTDLPTPPTQGQSAPTTVAPQTS